MPTTSAPPVEEITQTQRPSASPLRGALRSPWAVGFVVLLIYGLSLTAFFASGRDARDFIHMYRTPFSWGHSSSVIKIDPHYRYPPALRAYDGQWYYFIAVDPLNAKDYVDDPLYRYTKILYPMTARALALGRANLIPYTMILVNWLSIVAGTVMLALWLRRRQVSPWFALGYSFYLGTSFAYARDTVEPLSYALILAAIYAYDYARHRPVLISAVLFALAILARDKAVLFAGVWGLALLWPGRPFSLRRVVPRLPRAVMFFTVAGLPMLGYKAFLYLWMRHSTAHGLASSLASDGVQTHIQALPFTSLWEALHVGVSVLLQGPSVYLPAAILVVMLAWALRRGIWNRELAMLVVTLLPIATLARVYFVLDYYGIVRVSIDLVIAALLCAPTFSALTTRRWWLAGCMAGWCCFSAYFLIP